MPLNAPQNTVEKMFSGLRELQKKNLQKWEGKDRYEREKKTHIFAERILREIEGIILGDDPLEKKYFLKEYGYLFDKLKTLLEQPIQDEETKKSIRQFEQNVLDAVTLTFCKVRTFNYREDLGGNYIYSENFNNLEKQILNGANLNSDVLNLILGLNNINNYKMPTMPQNLKEFNWSELSLEDFDKRWSPPMEYVEYVRLIKTRTEIDVSNLDLDSVNQLEASDVTDILKQNNLKQHVDAFNQFAKIDALLKSRTKRGESSEQARLQEEFTWLVHEIAELTKLCNERLKILNLQEELSKELLWIEKEYIRYKDIASEPFLTELEQKYCYLRKILEMASHELANLDARIKENKLSQNELEARLINKLALSNEETTTNNNQTLEDTTPHNYEQLLEILNLTKTIQSHPYYSILKLPKNEQYEGLQKAIKKGDEEFIRYLKKCVNFENPIISNLLAMKEFSAEQFKDFLLMIMKSSGNDINLLKQLLDCKDNKGLDMLQTSDEEFLKKLCKIIGIDVKASHNEIIMKLIQYVEQESQPQKPLSLEQKQTTQAHNALNEGEGVTKPDLGTIFNYFLANINDKTDGAQTLQQKFADEIAKLVEIVKTNTNFDNFKEDLLKGLDQLTRYDPKFQGNVENVNRHWNNQSSKIAKSLEVLTENLPESHHSYNSINNFYKDLLKIPSAEKPILPQNRNVSSVTSNIKKAEITSSSKSGDSSDSDEDFETTVTTEEQIEFAKTYFKYLLDYTLDPENASKLNMYNKSLYDKMKPNFSSSEISEIDSFLEKIKIKQKKVVYYDEDLNVISEKEFMKIIADTVTEMKKKALTVDSNDNSKQKQEEHKALIATKTMFAKYHFLDLLCDYIKDNKNAFKGSDKEKTDIIIKIFVIGVNLGSKLNQLPQEVKDNSKLSEKEESEINALRDEFNGMKVSVTNDEIIFSKPGNFLPFSKLTVTMSFFTEKLKKIIEQNNPLVVESQANNPLGKPQEPVPKSKPTIPKGLNASVSSHAPTSTKQNSPLNPTELSIDKNTSKTKLTQIPGEDKTGNQPNSTKTKTPTGNATQYSKL